MERDDGFLGALLANPRDETLRLVYADWLDDRGDPRGEFLRVQLALQKCASDDKPRVAERAARLGELRTAIDPAWAATVGTVGVAPEPFAVWFKPGELPLAEPLALRAVRGAVGQQTGLVTFASQFRLSEPPDAGLAADLVMLADMIPGLCDCYYGAADFQIYGFLAEHTAASTELTESDVLAALQAQDTFVSGGYAGDSITQEMVDQCFFRHDGEEEEGGSDGEVSIRTFLTSYIAPAQLW